MNSIAFVVPCLNEEKTLGIVLDKLIEIKKIYSNKYDIEIIVSDNGSSDNSINIIKEKKVKLVNCQIKGYGAALKEGIENSKSDIIVFGDADNTYDFNEAPKLINKLLISGSDMVIGNRLNKKTEFLAMPMIHRYLGTPFLNFLINTFYSNKNNFIKDCNSGMRCFFKKKFLSLSVKGDGMEFASEMLVLAQINSLNIKHEDIKLHKDLKGRKKHLQTWKDGMRHLLVILRYSPSFFYKVSLIGFVMSWVFLSFSYLFGKTNIFFVSIFDIHSMLLGSLLSFLSSSIWGIGLMLENNLIKSTRMLNFISKINEDKLFFFTIINLLLFILFIFYIFSNWINGDMVYLNIQKEMIIITAFLGTIFNINIFTLCFYILKNNIK